MPFSCCFCDGHCSTGYQTTVYGLCPICFAESGHTKETIKLALETYSESSVDATGSVNNLFGDAIEIKAKTNGHKNENGHTAEIAIQTSEIFDYWRVKTEHPDAQLSTERAKVINKHLLGTGGNPRRSAEDLKKAILGYSIEPIEANGKKYDDITLLLRDAKHIEDGIARLRASKSRKKNQSRVMGGLEGYEDLLASIKNR